MDATQVEMLVVAYLSFCVGLILMTVVCIEKEIVNEQEKKDQDK